MLVHSGEFVQRLSLTVSSAEQLFANAAQRAQEALAKPPASAPIDLGAKLRDAASSVQAWQNGLALPASVRNGPAAQTASAFSDAVHRLQSSAAALVPTLDIGGIAQQAQQAAAGLVPSLPETPYNSFGRNQQPHFGTHAAAQAAQEVGSWVSSQLFNLETTNPEARLLSSAISSQLRAASIFLQHSVANPVQSIPQAIGQAISSGAASLRDAFAPVVSAAYPASLATWLESVAASVQHQSVPRMHCAGQPFIHVHQCICISFMHRQLLLKCPNKCGSKVFGISLDAWNIPRCYLWRLSASMCASSGFSPLHPLIVTAACTLAAFVSFPANITCLF